MTNSDTAREMMVKARLVEGALKNLLKDNAPSVYGAHGTVPEGFLLDQNEANVLCLQCNTFTNDETEAGQHSQNMKQITACLDGLGVPYDILGSDPDSLEADQTLLHSMVSGGGELTIPKEGYPTHKTAGRSSAIAIDLSENSEATLDKFRPAYAAEIKKLFGQQRGLPQDAMGALSALFPPTSRARDTIRTYVEIGGEPVKPVIKDHLEALRQAGSDYIDQVIREDLGLAPSMASRAGRDGANTGRQ